MALLLFLEDGNNQELADELTAMKIASHIMLSDLFAQAV